jgi:hypothetical protein
MLEVSPGDISSTTSEAANYTALGIKRGGSAPANRARPRWQDDAAQIGQDENKEDTAVSTITTERPEVSTKLPEWRRICHHYIGDSQRSVCGTATRKPGEDHYEDESKARGHTVCVVCAEICASGTLTK